MQGAGVASKRNAKPDWCCQLRSYAASASKRVQVALDQLYPFVSLFLGGVNRILDVPQLQRGLHLIWDLPPVPDAHVEHGPGHVPPMLFRGLKQHDGSACVPTAKAAGWVAVR